MEGTGSFQKGSSRRYVNTSLFFSKSSLIGVIDRFEPVTRPPYLPSSDVTKTLRVFAWLLLSITFTAAFNVSAKSGLLDISSMSSTALDAFECRKIASIAVNSLRLDADANKSVNSSQGLLRRGKRKNDMYKTRKASA